MILYQQESEDNPLEEMINRINQLAKKKREEGLSAEELKEQKELYALYLQNIRQQVKAQLDARVKGHPVGCECDCCGEHHHHHEGECHH
jgi:hypothetical protein